MFALVIRIDDEVRLVRCVKVKVVADVQCCPSSCKVEWNLRLVNDVCVADLDNVTVLVSESSFLSFQVVGRRACISQRESSGRDDELNEKYHQERADIR